VRNVAEDFHTQVRPRVEQLLAPGESLEGVCAATQQSMLVRQHHPGD
jgi:hypothetical protein